MNVETPVLRVRDLSVTIKTAKGPLHAVRGIDFDVMRGETLCIVGESGSGKSLTSLSLMNLLPPKALRKASVIDFGGKNLEKLNDLEMEPLRGDRIAMVFQDPMTSLNPSWTIGEQLVEGTLRHRPETTRAQARARAVELLEICGVPDPEGRLSQYPHQLSGGLRQRVMIAMALMTSPDLLIADEPTTALDATISAQIIDLLKDLQKKLGLAIILVTHDFNVVSRIADRIAVMYAGEFVEVGTAAEVLGNPLHPYTCALLACVPKEGATGPDARLGFLPGVVPSLIGDASGCQFRSRCPLAHEACGDSIPWQGDAHRMFCVLTAAQVTERHVDPVPPPAVIAPAGRQEAPTALLVSGVEQRYKVRRSMFGAKKTVQALRGIDLEVKQGEILGLVGESGSGKSTLARALLGLEVPASGMVRIKGQPIAELGRRDRARAVQPVFQDPYSSLNPRRTVEETIRLPLDIHQIGTAAERAQEARRLMDLCGLPARVAASQPSQLSGGQRQRVAIASALILKPEIVICDEPTSALDVSVQAQILNLLKDLRAELNLTYVLISHDLNVIRAMSDRVAVMYFGRIIETGSTEALFRQPSHPYTNLLLSTTHSKSKPALGGLAPEYPDPANPPAGCAFRRRCNVAMDACAAQDPLLVNLDKIRVACLNPRAAA
ncbi:ABC transporter ATP-binding protein [Rhizobium sp. Leaf262]|uniref:dipeptide ABC transporter ATP-binding protein n=1 Tax=Rhizobium sp. Leaf262 TaxID=1736312 RepID=UPI0007152BE3|nr:ABC transporter ATP-binding protein [Rhizobium sp. Leaf262]KQO75113.1 hypothetical protein ASF29_14545 [Rhizobium sp. Leaf262]